MVLATRGMNPAGPPELSSIRRVEVNWAVSDESQKRIPTCSISAPFGTSNVVSRSELIPVWKTKTLLSMKLVSHWTSFRTGENA